MNSKRRYYQVAGITLRVDSDLPITDATFHARFRAFAVDAPGDDVITIHHHFEVPRLETLNLCRELYRKPPWRIYRSEDRWFYVNIADDLDAVAPESVAIFSNDHSHGDIYSNCPGLFGNGEFQSLSLFTTDQIWLSHALADREAFFMHSSGVKFGGQGLLFLGHSEAGKSTMIKMLRDRAEILCDDRIIVRRWPDFFRIHGSWSHGEIASVSAAAAPLLAVFFLKKSNRNRIIQVRGTSEILGRLLACLIKPLCTADWWDKVLAVTGTLTREIPCYELEFDRSGKIVNLLQEMSGSQ